MRFILDLSTLIQQRAMIVISPPSKRELRAHSAALPTRINMCGVSALILLIRPIRRNPGKCRRGDKRYEYKQRAQDDTQALRPRNKRQHGGPRISLAALVAT